MILENIKLLGLNIKEFFWDIFWLIFVGFITNLFLHLIYWNLLLTFFPWKLDFFPLSFDVLKILVWILMFLIIRWFWTEKIKTWISLKQHESYKFDDVDKKLTDEKFVKEWIFQGNAQPYKGGLLVTNSNSGCLIKPTGVFSTKRVWKNFIAEMTIEFPEQIEPINPNTFHNPDCINSAQLPFENYLGIIFRAQSLDDYFMIEITKIGTHLVLRPHLRVGGNWDAPILNADVNSFNSIHGTIPLKISVEEDKVVVSQDSKSVRWLFPTHIDTNLIQRAKDKEEVKRSIIPEVYFRNRSGMFGFRCYGNQIAFVKSLKVYIDQ
jgi:hypothetical protein